MNLFREAENIICNKTADFGTDLKEKFEVILKRNLELNII